MCVFQAFIHEDLTLACSNLQVEREVKSIIGIGRLFEKLQGTNWGNELREHSLYNWDWKVMHTHRYIKTGH